MFEYLTVFENLELALKADRGVRASMLFRLNGEQLDRIGAMLTLIHLKDSAQRTAGLLSHGQKQWLEIGMLLMQDPKLLLLDEPVAGMTDEETERTAELFLSLEGSHSLVVVEHDMKFIGELTEGEGRQEGDGAARRQRARRRHAGRRAGEREGGRGLSWAALDAASPSRRAWLRTASMLAGVNQYYGGSHILRNVGFEAQARRGDGDPRPQRRRQDDAAEEPDGRGAGQDRHDHARRRDITKDTPYERVRSGIGYVPQGREIFGRLTVEENLRMGLAYKPGGTPIPAELFELFPVLKQMINRRGGDLSGGQQQQLAIARALAAGPKLLILDEPTEGIQPSIIKDIGRVIRMLADAQRRWPSCWSSSTTTSPPNWPTSTS